MIRAVSIVLLFLLLCGITIEVRKIKAPKTKPMTMVFMWCFHVFGFHQRIYQQRIMYFICNPLMIPKIHINNSFPHGKNLECVKSTFMQCVCDAVENFHRKSVKSRNALMWSASVNNGKNAEHLHTHPNSTDFQMYRRNLSSHCVETCHRIEMNTKIQKHLLIFEHTKRTFLFFFQLIITFLSQCNVCKQAVYIGFCYLMFGNIETITTRQMLVDAWHFFDRIPDFISR